MTPRFWLTPGAALSTDGSNGDLYLEANNCDVVCETVGYGTYADNGCHNVLNDCRITVDTHVAIIAGDAWVKFSGGTVKSNQYGAMLHASVVIIPKPPSAISPAVPGTWERRYSSSSPRTSI